MEIVHTNPHPDTLKNIAKKAGEVRFAILKDGTVKAGNAHKFVHTDLSNNPKEHSIEGFINHDYSGANEKVGPVKGLSYIAFHNSHGNRPSHPYLEKLKGAGINDRGIKGFHYDD